MYDNEFETKENNIQTEYKNEPQIYIERTSIYECKFKTEKENQKQELLSSL